MSNCLQAPPLRAPHSLPEADASAQAQSRQITEHILQAIDNEGGAIPFQHYMHMALYQPGLGYYTKPSSAIGASGDFTTAPEQGPVFGHCLANAISDSLQQQADSQILEYGAGSGALAESILQRLEQLNALPQRYAILEPSPSLRATQQQRLSRLPASLYQRIDWLQTLPEHPFHGAIVANEVLDAMPVVRFRQQGTHIDEQFITASGNNDAPLSSEYRRARSEVEQHIRSQLKPKLPDTDHPYHSEYNPSLIPWIHSLAEQLLSGIILLIDYGYPASEYYLAERDQGTLMCHYRQRAHPDPLHLPGLQDITAWVDFSAAAQAASDAGLALHSFSSQSALLIANGLETLFQEHIGDDPHEQLRLSQQIQTLTLPNQMGERFKALTLGKGNHTPSWLNHPLLQRMDARWRL